MSTSVVSKNSAVEAIFDRVRIAAELEPDNDAALARALKTGRSSISTWRKEGRIPFQQVVEFGLTNNFSIDWLFTGRGPRRLSDVPESRAPYEVAPEGAQPLRDVAGRMRRAIDRLERVLNEEGAAELPAGKGQAVMEYVLKHDLSEPAIRELLILLQ